MRDISKKSATLRIATAAAIIRLDPATIRRINEGAIPKGDPLAVAKVAAVQAAKNTSRIIPYCHPMPVEAVDVEFDIGEREVEIRVTVKAVYKTGVEMEALTAVAVAALTLYDMAKALDETMEITGVRLLSKHGGKSDFAETSAKPLSAAVLVISDSVSAGQQHDRSGRAIVERLKAGGLQVADYKIVSDEPETIEKELVAYADERKLDLVLTTGGTGVGPRDHTPEVMNNVIEREVPGIAETARAYGQERTPYAMLSRGRAGIRGHTIIINLPGSAKAVAESLDALFPGLLHAFTMLAGGGHSDNGNKARK